MQTVRARLDPSLSARVVRSVTLRYAAGADASLDRPAHVRSASGIARVGGRILVIQDDANFVAIPDPATGLCGSITLPAGEGGLRQFDDLRGNKRHKLDLESCVAVGDTLVAFGSGSAPARERIAIVEGDEARVIDASPLYAALRAEAAFAGSELNVEGAAVLGGTLRLFNRGNGAPRDGHLPVDASCDLDLAPVLRGEASPIRNITQYDLGTIRGLPLTFTDVAVLGDALLYAAAAEDSPDATRDGPVAGCALGIISGGEARYCEIGGTGKIEGILPISPGRILAVVDRDDPHLPSTLLELEVSL